MMSKLEFGLRQDHFFDQLESTPELLPRKEKPRWKEVANKPTSLTVFSYS